MNQEKVQQEVNNIIASIKAKGWHLSKTTKKALAEADALGLTPFLGVYAREDVKGAQIVNAILESAKDAGSQKSDYGMTDYGDYDGCTWTESPSALYLALHEDTATEPESAPEPETAHPVDIIRDMVNADDYEAQVIEYNSVEQYAAEMTLVDLARPNGKQEAREIARELVRSVKRGMEYRRIYRILHDNAPLGCPVPPVSGAELGTLTRPGGRYDRQITYRLVCHEMTVNEIAEKYDLTRDAVNKAIARGALPARQSGSIWLISAEDAEARWGKRQR